MMLRAPVIYFVFCIIYYLFMGFFPDAKGRIRIDFWIFSSENFEMVDHHTLPR